MKKAINFIFSIILAIFLIVLSFMGIFLNTIFSEEYVLKTLEKEDFYNNTYWLINSNFENYIYQSGLDEKVLENIVSKEKIKNDIKIAIENIYYQKQEKIDTLEIREKLYKNIENSLNTISNSQKKAINEFIDKICQEYESIISCYNLGTKININLDKIFSFTKLIKKRLLIFIGIDFLLLLVLNLNRMYEFISWIGVSFLTNGFVMLFANFFVKLNIKINAITIINDFVSEILRKTIFDILNKITTCGFVSLIIGVVLLIVSGIIQNKRVIKNEAKEKIKK